MLTTTQSTTTAEKTTEQRKDDGARVDVKSAAYVRMEARWQRCRDLMEGTDAIRRNASVYLPQLEGETDVAYEARVQLGAVFNGFERTVLASVGMLGVKDPTIENMPPKLEALTNDVDGAGTPLAAFLLDLAQHAIVDGHAGVFVDMPDVRNPEEIASDTADALGLRPYFLLVTADDEWLPFYETVSGKRTLTLFVRRERTSERFGLFGVRPIVKYFVYTLVGKQVIWQCWISRDDEQARADAEPVAMRNMTRIPYARLIAGQVLSEVETKPTLDTLANLNIEHHQTKNGILSLEQLAFVPTQVRIGAPKDPATGEYPEIKLGPRNTIEAPYMEGVDKPVYWHQPDVSVIEPAMATLSATETAMEVSGSAFLAPVQQGLETATSKRINAKAQNATLSRLARNTEGTARQAYDYAGEFVNETPGLVTISRDFEDTTMDAQTMTAYVNAVTAAGLPIMVLLKAWQMGGRIAADENLETLADEIMGNMAAIEEEKRIAALLSTPTDGSAPNGTTPNAKPTKPRSFSVMRDAKGNVAQIVEAAA